MQICDLLNAEGIPTPMGRPLWHKAYVFRVLNTQYVRDIMESGLGISRLALRDRCFVLIGLCWEISGETRTH
jgi:hypothetical protein